MDCEAVEEIAKLAKEAHKPGTIDVKDPRTGKVVPVGYSAGTFSNMTQFLDPFLEAPARRTGTAKTLTLEAFTKLASRHKDEDSAIFATITPPQLTAVIDYNRDGTVRDEEKEPLARFGKHRVVYDFPLTPQAKVWLGMDGKPMPQAGFADFIEDNVADLASAAAPERELEKLFHTKFGTPAELMQLSRGLAIRVKATVKDYRVVQSGESELEFAEEHQTASGGKLTVPGLFVASFPLFEGDAPSRAVARLRYRIADGKVIWFYKFYRFDDVVRAEVLKSVDKAASATGLPAFLGAPET